METSWPQGGGTEDVLQGPGDPALGVETTPLPWPPGSDLPLKKSSAAVMLRPPALPQQDSGSLAHTQALAHNPSPVEADPTGQTFTFEAGASKPSGGQGWADVWKKGCFAWEYKGKHRVLIDNDLFWKTVSSQ